MKYWKKQLLYPDGRKLKWFHLVVAIFLYFDFYLTGCILSNYEFTNKLSGYE